MEQGKTEVVELDKILFKPKKWTEEDLDKIKQIEASVREVGLLHPITIESDFTILAGQKRLEACRRAGMVEISCLIIPKGLPAVAKKELHIHENLFRFNLPWYEEVELKKQLHEMRIAQHGKGRPGAKVGWSLRDLAEELKQGLGTLSQDLRLAEAVAANPSLRKLQDKKTAMRIIFGEARRQDAEAEALDHQKGFQTDVVLCGDSSEILKQIPDKTFDLCITDPPWIDYKDEDLRSDLQTMLVFKELSRVLKFDSFLYAFVSTPDFITYSTELPKLGFKVQQNPLIWVKRNHLTHGLRSWEYSRDYEPCILAVKGTPALAISGQPSAVFTYPILHHTRSIHPNEKPIELIKQILEQCSFEGSFVLDPFGGSGVVAQACKELRRHYVVIERQHKYFEAIQKRLGAEVDSTGSGESDQLEETEA